MMPQAYARSNAPSIREWQCTDGRTDGLTQNPLTNRSHLAFSDAHAHTTKSADDEKSQTGAIAGDRAKESA